MTNMNHEENNTFEMIKANADFDITPFEAPIDFENTSKYTKLNLSNAQKRQISAMLQQVPMAAASGTMAQAYTVSFPDGLPHVLTELKQDGFGSMIRQDGKFVGSASFHEMSTQAAVMGTFTAMSVATGQYFMAQINNELSLINRKMDNILEFLYGDKKAELLSEISFVKYAHQNFASIMAHEPQRIATISSLQGAKKIAMKDIEFYLEDLDRAAGDVAKSYEDLDELLNKAFQIKDSLELSMQLYVMSSLVEVFYSQNMDKDYLQYLEDDMCLYINKCDKRILTSFSQLKGRISDYKGKLPVPIKKIDKTVNENKIGLLIDSMNSGEESFLKKTIHTTLHVHETAKVYYLDTEGNVYLKKA